MSYSTIQQCIDNHYALRVVCEGRNCTNDQSVDLLKLRDRLGPDHSTLHYDLADKFKCSRCGSRKVTLRFAPDHKRHLAKVQQERHEAKQRKK